MIFVFALLIKGVFFQTNFFFFVGTLFPIGEHFFLGTLLGTDLSFQTTFCVGKVFV
jgi:hypothetical protein